MALQSSGPISISDVLTEGGQSATRANTSLRDLENGAVFTINTASPSYPNGTTPSALSEWYSYDHSATSFYYWDLSNDIKWNEAVDDPLQSTSEDFSVSLWIRPQWDLTDLNLILFDLTPFNTTSTANRFFLQYEFGLNRFIARYRSNSVNFDRQWGLHQNNSATGTGTDPDVDKWFSGNRGDVNSDNFIHIALTYDASQSTATNAFKVYWNGSELTTEATSNSGTRSTMTLDEVTFCGNDHNTAGSRIADYMYMHMWDSLLSSTNVSSMYNSGTPISAADASLTTDLIFGDTSTSVPSVGAADDASNYAFLTANGQSLVAL